MKSNILVLALCLVIGIFLYSCKDDEVSVFEPDQINTDLEFQMRVGSDFLVEGETYTIDTTVLRVDVARFYFGNVTLTQDSTAFTEASTRTFSDYNIISPEDTRVNLGLIDEGIYEFEFGVGVDPETNDQTTDDFTTRPEGDPLGAQEPSMHWNWNSGYKFLRIDGEVDTDNDGVVDTPVQYHLGSDAYFAILNNSQVVEIDSDRDEIILRFDLAAFLDGVNIADGRSTHVMDTPDIAQQLLENYEQAFSLRN